MAGWAIGYKLGDGLRVSVHGDGAAILDVHRGRVFSANAVGGRVLALVAESRTLEEIADSISAEFGAEPDVVRRDVDAFIESLKANRLLRPVVA